MHRQRILLTGASGVVGSALLERLRHHRVICLTHRHPPAGDVRAVRGDITLTRLGLSSSDHRRLARDVDVVVHCAATTDFSAGAERTCAMNVAGTRHVLGFARAAGATVHYLSTAFVERTDLARGDIGDGSANPWHYLESKHAAEQLVREADVPTTIIRPSVVVGHSATGRITRFQGLHMLAAALLRNKLPLVPLRPDSRVDFVAQDRLADAVAALVDHGATGVEHWVTAGENALTARQMVDRAVAVANRMGVEVWPVRLVDPEMIDRLIRPVFVAPLTSDARRRFDDLVTISQLVSNATAFPSTLAQIKGCAALKSRELEQTFDATIEHLIRVKGLDRWTRAA